MNPDDVSLSDRRLEAEQKVGRRQMKEVERVGLEDLAVMHQPPHLLRGGRQLVDARDDVHRLACAEVMADWTNTAETLDDDRNFPVHPALDKPFEAPELDNMESRLFDFAGFV